MSIQVIDQISTGDRPVWSGHQKNGSVSSMEYIMSKKLLFRIRQWSIAKKQKVWASKWICFTVEGWINSFSVEIPTGNRKKSVYMTCWTVDQCRGKRKYIHSCDLFNYEDNKLIVFSLHHRWNRFTFSMTDASTDLTARTVGDRSNSKWLAGRRYQFHLWPVSHDRVKKWACSYFITSLTYE